MGQPNTAHAQQVAVGLDWVGWRGEGMSSRFLAIYSYSKYPPSPSSEI